MKRISFLLMPLLVLFVLGVLASSTKAFPSKYEDDSKMAYFETKKSNVVSYWTHNNNQELVLGEATRNILVTFAASYVVWLMFLGLGVLWLTDGKIKKEQVAHALIASFLAWLVTEFIKQIFHTPRPFMIDGFHPLTATIPTDSAFPSSHTALAFATATIIWFHDKKVGIIFIILALLVGIARIMANVHYPVDIMGGAVVGLATAFLMEKIHFPVLRK